MTQNPDDRPLHGLLDLLQSEVMAALGEEIAARHIVVGEVSLPRNARTRRTASKIALLEQIAEASGNW